MEETFDQTPTPFGYELLRDHILPSILGKHEDDILYWAGKELARKFPMFEQDELPVFFNEAGWGTLSLVETGKDEAFYSLRSRQQDKFQSRSCQLEAGFIAEQYQKLNGLLTECYGSFANGSVTFQVKWDLKTKVYI